ncbi:MAG TPA: tRNA pseudouridine(55) synthase TruB [Longimicrobiales bacterium]|nr:tRNA pseudouridine(55) synthase TruB [Longimicrobiales bacterium]
MNPFSIGGAILPLDKAPGPTSHDVVTRVRRVLDIRKVGHTGTLDPFASGLLLLCLGSATRLSEYLTGLDKTYLATVRLGVATTTHDPEGEVVGESRTWEDLERFRVEEVLQGFRGDLLQRPPAFSAKKVRGEAAHRRARRGEAVELPPAEVRIDALEVVEWGLPDLRIRVRCSSGTYVRALARDLGEALGTGAHLRALRRTTVGDFRVEDALPLERLAAATAEEYWIPPARALAHLPDVLVDAEQAALLADGRWLTLERDLPPGPIAVRCGPALVAVATADGRRLRPRKVFR